MQGKAFADTITIAKPDAGRTEQCDVRPGGVYVLDFSLDAATFDRQGEDVRVDFDDGAVLSLHNFISASARGDFILELPDGTRLSGKDVSEMFSLVLQDFHTDGLADDSGLGDPGMSGTSDRGGGSERGGQRQDEDSGREEDFASLIESAGAGIAPLCHSVCEISLEHPLSELPMAEIPRALVEEAQNPAPRGSDMEQAAQTTYPHDRDVSAALTGDGLAPLSSPYGHLPRITQSSLLRIEDVLDTSTPALPDPPRTHDAGAFLFEPLQEYSHGVTVVSSSSYAGSAFPPDPFHPDPFASGSDRHFDGISDPLLLAFFRLGCE